MQISLVKTGFARKTLRLAKTVPISWSPTCAGVGIESQKKILETFKRLATLIQRAGTFADAQGGMKNHLAALWVLQGDCGHESP